MSDAPMKLCMDCLHFEPVKEIQWVASHKCGLLRTKARVEPVCGKVFPAVNIECCIARRDGHRCGPEAKLFKPRRAQAIEAGTGETEGLDAKHESAVRQDAPKVQP